MQRYMGQALYTTIVGYNIGFETTNKRRREMEKSDEIVKLLHNILETLQNVDNKLAKMNVELQGEEPYTIKSYLRDIKIILEI